MTNLQVNDFRVIDIYINLKLMISGSGRERYWIIDGNSRTPKKVVTT